MPLKSRSYVIEAIARVKSFIDEADLATADLSSRTLEGIANLGHNALSKNFREIVGEAPQDYIRNLRVARAYDLITHPAYSLVEIASQCGFSSSSGFYHAFTQATGASPSHLRKIQQEEWLAQAKILMRNPEMKLEDISSKLGFPSRDQFGRFFKRETGLSPQQYRSKNGIAKKLTSWDKQIEQILNEIDSGIIDTSQCTYSGLSKRHKIHRYTLRKHFLERTGMSPQQYIETRAINIVKELLYSGIQDYETIAARVGYPCVRTMKKRFMEEKGVSLDNFVMMSCRLQKMRGPQTHIS